VRLPERRWFHSYDLGGGNSVQGVKPVDLLKREADIVFSEGVKNKTVIDIGAWDGFFSFEAEKRGAKRVLATDHFCWSGPGWGDKQGFDAVHAAIGSNVETRDIDVPDITETSVGQFDVVLFLGVLYHLKDPLIGLERIAAITKEYAVIETVTILHDIDEPVMRFFLFAEFGGDGSNYWAPNHKCLENMMREVGFTRFKFVPQGFRGPEAMRTFVHAWK
jgi:tRNA (mo5U34)-methyltransferase